MKIKLLLASTLLMAIHAFAQGPNITPTIRKALDGLDTAELRSHIAFLADDILRGRKKTRNPSRDSS